MAEIPPNLRESVASCRREASAQVDTASALDAKLMGILAFMVAVVGLLLTLPHGLEAYRWILLAGTVGGIVISLVGLMAVSDPEVGPDPVAFYKEFGGADPPDFMNQLFADLRATLGANAECLERRRDLLTGAFAVVVAASALFGLVRALVAILS